MASSTSGDGSFNDPSSFGDDTKPWPNIPRQRQADIENRFFEQGATIRFDRLPPHYLKPKRAEFVVYSVLNASRAANRKLNQTEIDAVSESAVNAVGRQLSVYLPSVGLGLAAAAAATGRKKFRFPMYTPKMKVFDPRVFPHRSFAMLTGKSAVYMWHGIRTAAYLPLTWLASTLFFASMARTRMVSDLSTDQRLSQVKQDMINNSQRRQIEQRRHQSTQGAQGAPQGPNQLPAASSANQSSDQDAWTRVPTGQAQAAQATGMQEQERQTSFDDDDLFDEDDDASPVAASARRSERQSAQRRASQSEPASSSWDTIRQQARNDTSPFAKGDRSKADTPWGRMRQDGAKTTRDASRTPAREGYAYNEADEEKAYAKDQAQKEFDAMLEAERQGRFRQ